MTIIPLKKIIFKYSAKKIKVKKTLLYSVLKPLTSSLSLSDKSMGARWVSIIKSSQKIRSKGGIIALFSVNFVLILFFIKNKINNKIPKLISNLKICETLRTLPRLPYFL